MGVGELSEQRAEPCDGDKAGDDRRDHPGDHAEHLADLGGCVRIPFDQQDQPGEYPAQRGEDGRDGDRADPPGDGLEHRVERIEIVIATGRFRSHA